MVTEGDSIRVLVVEDEESYRQALSRGWAARASTSRWPPTASRRSASSPSTARHRPARHAPAGDAGHRGVPRMRELVPGAHRDGQCRRRRARRGPRASSSARPGYVTKPFRLRELVARMHAILRRVSPTRGAGDGRLPGPEPRVEDARRRAHRPDTSFGSVTVDFVRREVTWREPGPTSPAGSSTCWPCCCPRPGWVRTRDELIDLLWPDRFLSDSRTLDTHIHRLRAKLEPDPAEPRYIVTVRGVGFRIDPDGTPDPPPSAPRPGPGRRWTATTQAVSA